jgi:DNA invertase Pin-like site-specific DNA recombinase
MVPAGRPLDIYVRVSRIGGREHLISPEEQERRARSLAKERGLHVGKVLRDLDESGGKWDRPGLQEALSRVESGASGGVIVAWLDRLSRDSEHALRLVRSIHDAGGTIYAPDAPSDWLSPEGELQTGIMFAFAQYVRSRARSGFERAKENAIATGVPVKSRPPVGYRQRSTDDRRLEPDPEVAPIIREVFERRAAGAGPAELGTFLAERGVKTSQGSKAWTKPTIYNLLRNRTYLGELHYGRDDRFVNLTAHEPIVDEALWRAAQHPNGRRLAEPRSQASSYLLAGIIRCAACRYCLQGTTTSRGARIYRCTRTHSAGVCPAPARVSADDAEKAAVAAFWRLTTDLEAEGTRADDAADRRAELQARLDRADAALRQWMSPDVQEAIGDLQEYTAGLRERRATRDAAAQELDALLASAETRRRIPGSESLRRAWTRMSIQQRRELLGLRFDCLALRRDRSIVVYPAGTAPTDLPRRGFTRAPELVAFPDAPDGSRVLTL